MISRFFFLVFFPPGLSNSEFTWSNLRQTTKLECNLLFKANYDLKLLLKIREGMGEGLFNF